MISPKSKKRFNKHNTWATAAMKGNEQARNSDWELIFTVFDILGVGLSNEQEQKIKTSGVNMHTLIRERQKIQGSGLYLPTDQKVLKERRKLVGEYAENYGNK